MSMERETPVKHSMQQARDILAKWSSSDLLDRISSLPELPAMPSPHFSGASNPIEHPADQTETPSAIESKSEMELDTTASMEREADALGLGVEQPDIAEPAPVTESVAEPPIQPEPQLSNDRLTADSTDSNDALTATSQSKDTLTPHVPPALPVITAHQAEHPTDDVHASVKPSVGAQTSTLGHEGTEPKAPQRKNQQRTVQQRQHQNRKRSAAVSSKGSSAVTKKFRIDTPGDDSENLNADSTADAVGSTIRSNSGTGGQRYRLDSGEPAAETVETGSYRARTQGPARRRYIDEPHDSAIRGPHFQVTAPRRSNITSITGQFLAYAGVLGLTIGTAMVIYGHFGGYSEYTPTGWLVTTVAQMMLFLGVINLVSGGIEQTNDDVSQRINVLGEQLRRIEQVTEEALRGPKIPAHRYANPDAIESDRDVVPAGERI